MIANITTIFYILSVSDECINSGTLQKGTAISRIDNNDGFQIYKFYKYLTSTNADSELDNNFDMNPFEQENMYLISGKFSVAQDGSINVNIITSVITVFTFGFFFMYLCIFFIFISFSFINKINFISYILYKK